MPGIIIINISQAKRPSGIKKTTCVCVAYYKSG